MLLDTRPYRRAMKRYQEVHGLAPEPGFDVTLRGPLRKPGRRLLLRVQRHMVARKVVGVSVSGVLDRATRDALLPPMTLGEKTVAYAMSQLNVSESPWGSNSGPQIEMYQAVTGAFHAPWCASFVSWAKRRAGYHGPVTASAYAWARIGQQVDLSHAQVGDAVSFRIGQGHVGLYLSHDATSVRTIDGNTSNEVAIRDRPIYQIYHVTHQT